MQDQNYIPAKLAHSESYNIIYLFSEESRSKEIYNLLKINGISDDAIAWDNPSGEKEPAGWNIQIEHLPIVTRICKQHGFLYHEIPHEGLKFGEIKASSVIDFLEKNKTDIARSYPKIIDEYERLDRTISSKRTTLIKSEIPITFICDNKQNYLKDLPPVAPTLISIMYEGRYQCFIRKGIVGQIVGAGGIGKTHFLSQLALSFAAGKPFLDEKFSIGGGGYVFLGLGENSDDDIHRLLKKMSELFMKDKSLIDKASQRLAVKSFCGFDASFVDHNGKPTTFFNDFFDSLKANEPEEGWSLIILDPISRFLGAHAENDNAAATLFVALLEKITIQLRGKPTVLFGHHMNKSGFSSTDTDQTAARGSSAITDGVRWQANLERVPKADNEKEIDRDKVRFKIVKSNFTRLYDSIELIKDANGCLSLIENQQNYF